MRYSGLLLATHAPTSLTNLVGSAIKFPSKMTRKRHVALTTHLLAVTLDFFVFNSIS